MDSPGWQHWHPKASTVRGTGHAGGTVGRGWPGGAARGATAQGVEDPVDEGNRKGGGPSAGGYRCVGRTSRGDGGGTDRRDGEPVGKREKGWQATGRDEDDHGGGGGGGDLGGRGGRRRTGRGRGGIVTRDGDLMLTTEFDARWRRRNAMGKIQRERGRGDTAGRPTFLVNLRLEAKKWLGQKLGQGGERGALSMVGKGGGHTEGRGSGGPRGG